MKIWLDGGLQDTESARVSVFDHGLTVGDGIFETVKAVHGTTFALTRHLDRLTRSARGLGLPYPDHSAARRACAPGADEEHGGRHAPPPPPTHQELPDLGEPHGPPPLCYHR